MALSNWRIPSHVVFTAKDAKGKIFALFTDFAVYFQKPKSHSSAQKEGERFSLSPSNTQPEITWPRSDSPLHPS